MFLARDKYGHLTLYEEKPIRKEDSFVHNPQNSHYVNFGFVPNINPEVTWENSPVMVAQTKFTSVTNNEEKPTYVVRFKSFTDNSMREFCYTNYDDAKLKVQALKDMDAKNISLVSIHENYRLTEPF